MNNDTPSIEQAIAAGLMGKTEKQIVILQDILSNDPTDPQPWVHLAQLHSRLGDGRGVMRQFVREGLQFCPESPELLVWAGEELLEQGDHNNARDYFLRALDIKDSLAVAWANLGSCHDELNEPELAVVAYVKARQFDPKNASWGYRLAMIQLAMGDVQGAFDSMQHVEVNLPMKMSIPVQMDIAVMELAMGRHDEAEARMVAVEQLAPGDIRARLYRLVAKGHRVASVSHRVADSPRLVTN